MSFSQLVDAKCYVIRINEPVQSAYNNLFERKRRFTQDNFVQWLSNVKQQLAAQPYQINQAVLKAKEQGKYRRHKAAYLHDPTWDEVQFKAFSIMSVDAGNGQSLLFVPTPFLAGEAGSFGVCKIAYELQEQDDAFVLRLDKPIVLKIIYDQHISGQELTDSLGYWQALYPESTLFYRERLSSGVLAQRQFFMMKKYIAIPLLQGRDMQTLLADCFPMISDDVIAITNFQCPTILNFYQKIQICIAIVTAVHGLHRKNICHRDLKPENILLQFNGEQWCAYVVDLDKARPLGTINTSAHYDMIGTPDYMPPEFVSIVNQSHDSCQYNVQYDTYMLGALLAELFIDKHRGYYKTKEGDISQYQGICYSRIETGTHRWRQFDKIVLNKVHLNFFPWQDVYFSKVSNQSQWLPMVRELIALLQQMIAKQPTERISLETALPRLNELAMQAKTLSYATQYTQVTPPAPIGEPLRVFKPAPVANSSDPRAVSPAPQAPQQAPGVNTARLETPLLGRRARCCGRCGCLSCRCCVIL